MPFFRRREKVEAGLKKTRETFFGRIAGLLSRSTVDEALWEELEEALISADAGAKLTIDLLERVRARAKSAGATTGEAVRGILRAEIESIMCVDAPSSPLLNEDGAVLPASPYVVLVVGVNGAGKTTSIAKLANLLSGQGKSVVLAAGDTFRAAGIEQLEVWAGRVNAEIVAHRHGADPGAVVFDALQAAKARGADVVIIDTAGRLHTKTNLMEELRKVRRVAERFDEHAPHETLLVLDATTGQNGLAQAGAFAEVVGVTGLVLAKLDGSARGGAAIGIADTLKLPIVFVGAGEGIDDLVPFDGAEYAAALFADGAPTV